MAWLVYNFSVEPFLIKQCHRVTGIKIGSVPPVPEQVLWVETIKVGYERSEGVSLKAKLKGEMQSEVSGREDLLQ